MQSLQIDYKDPDRTRIAEELKSIDEQALNRLTALQWDSIGEIWKDEGIQHCYDRRNEFQLVDSCK